MQPLFRQKRHTSVTALSPEEIKKRKIYIRPCQTFLYKDVSLCAAEKSLNNVFKMN